MSGPLSKQDLINNVQALRDTIKFCENRLIKNLLVLTAMEQNANGTPVPADTELKVIQLFPELQEWNRSSNCRKKFYQFLDAIGDAPFRMKDAVEYVGLEWHRSTITHIVYSEVAYGRLEGVGFGVYRKAA